MNGVPLWRHGESTCINRKWSPRSAIGIRRCTRGMSRTNGLAARPCVNTQSLATSSCVSSALPRLPDPHKSDEQCVSRCSRQRRGSTERLDVHLVVHLSPLARPRLTETHNNLANSHDPSLAASSNQRLKAPLPSRSREPPLICLGAARAHRSLKHMTLINALPARFHGVHRNATPQVCALTFARVTLMGTGESGVSETSLRSAAIKSVQTFSFLSHKKTIIRPSVSANDDIYR